MLLEVYRQTGTKHKEAAFSVPPYRGSLWHRRTEKTNLISLACKQELPGLRGGSLKLFWHLALGDGFWLL